MTARSSRPGPSHHRPCRKRGLLAHRGARSSDLGYLVSAPRPLVRLNGPVRLIGVQQALQ